MSSLDVEMSVVVVRHSDVFRWFRSDRELWILDYPKWRQDFINAGFALPPADPSKRFGIQVVDEHTMSEFLEKMRKYEIDFTKLRNALKSRLPEAESWWDVGKLFPIMFVNCDRKHVAAFYPDGARMERYIPDGWTGAFDDFASTSSEIDFPVKERFWVQEGVDFLKLLNERGNEAV